MSPFEKLFSPTSALIGLIGLPVVFGAVLYGCSGDTSAPEANKEPVKPPEVAPAPVVPVQEPLVGGPYPTLLLTSAQFVKTPGGKPKPGPALLSMWRKTPDGWKVVKLEDAASNVFHKALPYDGGILTIGAEKAWLKLWKFADGKWSSQDLWNPSWGGKFNRIRDLEIGDVNGDGADDFVMATHDYGVVAVASMKDGKADVVELNKQPDTFVHEIEIGDIDGDGKKEFFATPSGRNQSSGVSQPGEVAMFRWDGTTYQKTVVDSFEKSHAKEILAVDLQGKGKSDLFAVIEAETELQGGQARVVKPVEIRHYELQKDGSFKHTVAATIDDKQTRFLVPGDFDGDGQKELVAAAMTTGLWVLEQGKDGTWTSTNIEKNSSGFEHTAFGADLDNDGKLELYVAADEQHELRQYVYDAATKTYVKSVLGPIQNDTITWNMSAGQF